jgi:large subunit ribosomal protein L14
MIFNGTILNVCDNSGVKWVQCIKVLGGKPKTFGRPGDIIVVSIKTAKSLSKIKKKDIYKAIIVRVKKKISREDGSSISFSQNSAVLLNVKGTPIGSRVFGPVAKELRIKKNIKLISLCTKML